jgi:hypothetical protein
VPGEPLLVVRQLLTPAECDHIERQAWLARGGTMMLTENDSKITV